MNTHNPLATTPTQATISGRPVFNEDGSPMTVEQISQPLEISGQPITVGSADLTDVSQVHSRLVIIHDTDADGISAAWCIQHHMKHQFDSILCIPQRAGVNDIPEGLTEDDEVFLVDRTYPWLTLIKLSDSVLSVTVLDHHKSAMMDYYREAVESGLYELKEVSFSDAKLRISYGNIAVLIDTTHAACYLAWQYGHNWAIDSDPDNPEPPWFISYIEDRDMWWFKLPDSKEVNAGLHYYEHTFDNYNTYFDNSSIVNQMINVGEIVCNTHKRLIKGISHGPTVKFYTPYDFINSVVELRDLNVAIACCPFTLISDFGDYMLNYDFNHTPDDVLGKTPVFKVDAVIVYNLVAETGMYTYSIRSKLSMLWLAKLYGGGGHPNACGFTTSIPPENVLKINRQM